MCNHLMNLYINIIPKWSMTFRICYSVPSQSRGSVCGIHRTYRGVLLQVVIRNVYAFTYETISFFYLFILLFKYKCICNIYIYYLFASTYFWLWSEVSVQNARKPACFIFYRSVTTSTQLEDRWLSAPHSRKGIRLLAYPRLRHSFLLSMFGFVYVSTSNSHHLDHSEKHYLEYPTLEPKGYEAGM